MSSSSNPKNSAGRSKKRATRNTNGKGNNSNNNNVNRAGSSKKARVSKRNNRNERNAETNTASLVETCSYVGAWQPLMTMTGEEDDTYVAYSAMLLSLHIVWPSASSMVGRVQGQISWHYGMLQASSEALSHQEQMFWPSGSQTEMITGDVTRTTRASRRHMQFHFRTTHNGMGVLDANHTNQEDVSYTFQRFETPRTFAFETALLPPPPPPRHVEYGSSAAATSSSASSAKASEELSSLIGTIRVQDSGDRSHFADDHQQEEPFPETQVQLFPVSEQAAEYTSTQNLLENHRMVQNRIILSRLSRLNSNESHIYPQKLLTIIARIIQEPTNPKVRSINPDKIKWPVLLKALEIIGFEERMESMNNGSRQSRLIWPSSNDLLQLCELYHDIIASASNDE